MIKLDCVVWEITLRCNANCIHCGSNAGTVRDDELTTEEVFDVINQLESVGCKNLNLIGGEIFLRHDWKDIISKLSETSLNLSLITNGIALTLDAIEFLKNANIKTLGISIDGASEYTCDQIRRVPGLLNKIINAIKLSNESDISISAITTFNKFNLLELPEILNLLIENNVKLLQVQIASANGRMENTFTLNSFEYYILGLALARYRKIIDKNKLAIVGNHDFGYYSQTIPVNNICENWQGCPAGISTLGIRSNGKVQGCLSLPYDDFVEFDLRKDKLDEIWNTSTFCSWNKKKELSGFCKTCEHSFYCQAGCSDLANSLSGELGNNPNCYYRIEEYWKSIIPESDFESVFKDITMSKIDGQGKIIINNFEILSDKYLSGFRMSEYELKLLKLLYA